MKRAIMVNLVFLALAGCGGEGLEGTTPPPAGGGSPLAPVVTAPEITTQPAAQSVTAPAAATFTVAASGTAPLSYQWRSSTNGTDWVSIAGATGASYDTGATDAGMSGRHLSVVVSNSAGSTTSAAVQLTVAAPPSSGPPPSSTGLAPLPGPADMFPHAPAPMAVTAVTGSRSNGALISWDPQSTGAVNFSVDLTNSARASLRVPLKAFVAEVSLNMVEVTALNAVGGAPAPFTSVLAAVRVDPADLTTERQALTAVFTLPASLTNGVALGDLVGFMADSDGSNLHLVPIIAGPTGAQAAMPAIQVDHLGIVGIAVATGAQRDVLAASWPVDQGDQFAAAVARPATAAWVTTVQPSMATPNRTFAQTVRAAAADDNASPLLGPVQGFFNNAVVPAFAAAYGDPAQIPAAIQTGFQFLRQAELLGLSGPGGPLQAAAEDINGRISTLLDTYADYLKQQCSSIGGPPQLQAMLGWMRTLQLLGHDEKSRDLEDGLSQCSRFQVKFHHEFMEEWHRPPGQIDLDYKLTAVVDGTATVGLNMPLALTPMRLTSLTLQTLSAGGGTQTAEPESDTSPMSAFDLSVPVLKTRQGPPATSLSLSLLAYGSQPLQMTVTTMSNGSATVSRDVLVPLRLEVPALPSLGGNGFGPILIPASGTATSTATLNPLAYGETSHVRTHRVTVTLERAPAQ